MLEQKISIESAKKQMDLFLDYYDMDQNDIAVDQGPEAIETILNRLIRAISVGLLEVQLSEGNLKVTQYLKFPMGEITKIDYSEFGQKAKYAADGISNNKPTQKMHALMASLAGVSSDAFIKLKAVDSSIMERLATLFMVV